ncbi:unnamed protein product [Psylliodes chrysocephalus]|uniref:Peptidase S1 domain-containing protein n=1 Tax=Psylliodes chrysocephalus TaxID=3402493 RepID=A0A9P0CVW9_9CUCU|nr:unnamed protein product [Psylliodes chrysocephala]
MKSELVFILLGFVLLLNTGEGSEVLGGFSNFGIIGGEDAAPGQFPYQVSIKLCRSIFWQEICDHFCGGSIIAPNWILTAGHCFDYGIKTKIYAGILNISEDSDFRQIIEVNQTFVHEEYRGNANPNDIRLYQLKAPLVYTERVQPIALPLQDSDYTGEVISSGWGYTTAGLFPHLPETLQFQISNMPDRETCLELCNGISKNPFNVTTNVCTENPGKDRGTCFGDSGGPLVQNATLVGLTSWGFEPCGKKDAPSAYTRVSHYIDWIKERVPELS